MKIWEVPMIRVIVVAFIQLTLLYYFTWFYETNFIYLPEVVKKLEFDNFNIVLGYIVLLGVLVNVHHRIDALVAAVSPLASIGLMVWLISETRPLFFLRRVDTLAVVALFYVTFIILWIGVPIVLKWAADRWPWIRTT